MAATVSGRRERTTATKASKQAYIPQSKPSDDDIRILAYHLYERRQAQGTIGDAAADWIEAERQLRPDEAAERPD